MRFDPLRHHRESVRLFGWDYSQSALYYITIVSKDREPDFGKIVNNTIQLSPLGIAVETCWKQIPEHHAGVSLDQYVIMPNHLHGIVIVGNGIYPGRDVQLNVPTKTIPHRLSPVKGSLSVIVRTFKAAVTTWARRNGHGYFAWQPRFHDHIIRDEEDLARIREYIRENPLNWATDDENPGKKSG